MENNQGNKLGKKIKTLRLKLELSQTNSQEKRIFLILLLTRLKQVLLKNHRCSLWQK